MSLQPIPDLWRSKVCAALKDGDPNRVEYTFTGGQRTQNELAGLLNYNYEIEDALREALMVPCEGCPCIMGTTPGVTWEFFFYYRSVKLYGKILLRLDLKRLLIFSAHLPERSTLKCDDSVEGV